MTTVAQSRELQEKLMAKRVKNGSKYEKQYKGLYGVLHITLVEARNLKDADAAGKSDPYVRFGAGKKAVQSGVIANDLNPVWNEKLDLPIVEQKVVHVKIYDQDVGFDDCIGSCDLDAVLWADGSAVDKWFDLKKQGQLHLKLKYESLKLDGEISVTLVEAKELKPLDGKTSDPYAKIKIGKKEHKTKTIKKTLTPVWGEEFKWTVNGETGAYISVWDQDFGGDDREGFVEIKFKNWINHMEKGVDEWFDLHAQGKIRIKMLYRDKHRVY